MLAKYKNTLNQIKDIALDIYKDNLKCIFLGGSLANGKEIDNWSDIDIYVVTKKYDIESNFKFYKKLNIFDIHIGTTFYDINLIKDLKVDSKSIATFIEYNNNFIINKYIYGSIEIPKVDYSMIFTSKIYIFDLVQKVERELFQYILNHNNIKSLVKKITLLMKVVLNVYYNDYAYGYDKVFNDYEYYRNINLNVDINNIIKNSDINNELIGVTKVIIYDLLERIEI